MATAQPVASTSTSRTVLAVLTRARLLDLARDLDVAVAASGTKEALTDSLVASGVVRFRELLQRLGRDELRTACRSHGLSDASRSRPELMGRLLQAHGATDSVPPKALFGGRADRRDVPRKDDIVRCRHRQWLVEAVRPSASEGGATLVSLVCLDDDSQGRPLDVLWELELGGAILQPEAHGLGDVHRIDPPRHFAAYLHALKWNAVTATDARLFQAPFRAGIQLMDHQLTPLRKALLLPRVNLFIADDVGLGKTIEAGLVLQELLLRQRVEYALIVCPPSVALQWQGEMQVRFGLHFEIYNRAFVARRRQERGFAVNPWSTHARFIVSYQTLRRPEHRDSLLAHLGDRKRKSLLILDEAHTAAPASSSKYAIDSRITDVVRGMTGAFENRLFLSATPHNGHSNSFSALLEMLDPNRFTRGVDVDPAAREAVMIRRLKEDLRRLELRDAKFPRRDVLRVDLDHADGEWRASYFLRTTSGAAMPSAPAGQALGKSPRPVELDLAEMLAEYTSLMKPERGRGRLVFVNLQKRLLSSVSAFYRTLQLHADGVASGRARTQLDLRATAAPERGDVEGDEDDEYGADDEAQNAEDSYQALASSRLIESPQGRARTLLDAMTKLASDYHVAPDAKALALLDWIRRHQCQGARVGGLPRGASKADRAWSQTRVIVFTEYGDTKRWLRDVLDAAIAGTSDAEHRIMEFHGGMSDEKRAEVQEAFNSPPSEHAVRILLATDAAREGVNLQGACADLFHFDIPWNPARIEQRNGRIDRTLQPAEVVRCHYFAYPRRTEDVALDTIVEKVGVIREELGSLGSVVMERLEVVLARGIDAQTSADLAEATRASREREVAKSELEAERADLKRVGAEIAEAARILQSSRKVLDFDPPLLRDALDVGLELSGIAGRLEPVERTGAFTLPEMPEAWRETLDSIRVPRAPGEHDREWRERPLPPVTFRAAETLADRRVHLHLSHPIVQRVMSRFLAQGFSTHDLSRVTVVRSRHDDVMRTIAFGRLSLFGPGATRLHDQLVMVAAHVGDDGALEPGTDTDDRKALDRLETLLTESPTLDRVTKKVQGELRERAPGDFKKLWEPIKLEADALSHKAEADLKKRGKDESVALRKILMTQRDGIGRKLVDRQQTELPFGGDDRDSRDARKQWESETSYLEGRKASIVNDIESEPAAIEKLYEVRLRRLEPVGLVYIWPETRG